MNGLDRCSSSRPEAFTVAIIGGGFSGAVLAYHLARHAPDWFNIVVFEPSAQLGAGVAYGTCNPVHRLNAPAQRMSMLPDDPGHFVSWMIKSGACDDDSAALRPDGRVFPRREIYGAYVAAQLAPFVAKGRVRHIKACAADILDNGHSWSITSSASNTIEADITILATGHAPPEPPALLGAAFSGHPGFVANPTLPHALEKIGVNDRVLVVGTGLTMLDVVGELAAKGHAGPVHAVSRRGQIPRDHGPKICPQFGEFVEPPCLTALDLLRRARLAFAANAATGAHWQGVIEALRCQGQDIWAALKLAERRRFLRHLRPYWDSHRYRAPPQLGEILAAQAARGTFSFQAASITAAEQRDDALAVTLSGRNGAECRVFDAVIVTTGPGRATEQNAGPGLSGLIRDGHVTSHPAGTGLACTTQCQAINAAGQPVYNLLLCGTLTRGTFGEITAAPEITRQAEAIARRTITAARLINASPA